MQDDLDKQYERCGFGFPYIRRRRGNEATLALRDLLQHKTSITKDNSFNADLFCQVKSLNGLELIDLDWVRKENCSAFQAWILSGKVKEDCVLNMELELRQRVEKMVHYYV